MRKHIYILTICMRKHIRQFVCANIFIFVQFVCANIFIKQVNHDMCFRPVQPVPFVPMPGVPVPTPAVNSLGTVYSTFQYSAIQ